MDGQTNRPKPICPFWGGGELVYVFYYESKFKIKINFVFVIFEGVGA